MASPASAEETFTLLKDEAPMEKFSTDVSVSHSAKRGQVTLVLQGGGALGAYQAGVYQAMHEAGIEPDWVIGTSIGAINASLIAGNDPLARLAALKEFWGRMETRNAATPWSGAPRVASSLFGDPFAAIDNISTFICGIPGFFEPNYSGLFGGAQKKLGVEKASLYSTRPLRKTLAELIDFDLVNRKSPRLTVGAARVGTGLLCYFDSRDMALSIDHVMASGALPLAFPPIYIDGHYYWDGGILSNTPIEAVFDDVKRRDGVVFTVHVWNAHGANPETLWQVLNRQKDIQYSSRDATHIARQKQIHKLRHIIKELAAHLPEEKQHDETVKDLVSYGCLTRMHVVRLQAPPLEDENHLKDIDFSAQGIRKRWSIGYKHTMRAIEQAPWQIESDPLDGCDPS